MKRLASVVAAAALAVAAASCSGNPSDYPHTVNNGGVWHGEGIDDPVANCTECHGDMLQGTDTTPSCTDCHDRRW